MPAAGRVHTRRDVLVGLVAGVALSGCATGRRILGLPGTAATADDSITLYPFRRDDVDALGVPALGVTIENSQPGLMLLTRYMVDDGLHWESTNRYSLVTRAGRIVATRGFRRDLQATRFMTEDPLAQQPPHHAGSLVRSVSLVPGDHRAVSCHSRLQPQDEAFVVILEREYRALRVTERVEVNRWQWSTENTYWIEVNSGTVIRSIQQVSPDGPRIVIDLLKAPA